MPRNELQLHATFLGLEVVPLLFKGEVSNVEHLKHLLSEPSFLGGQREGLVFKNKNRFGIDGKPLYGKYVSDAFKEVHQKDWKARSPSQGDIIEQLIERYMTPARWNKAVYRLRDENRLSDSPTDIGPLMGEISKDVMEECKDEIALKLWKWAWPKIARGVVRGLPEWYKEQLANQQFDLVA